ncbi:Neurofibromin [Harpegnathos saltator]|uniref:Neurofibromin n=1 Tax=Harpegnathos saltator TaxID=610380 RepID=E2B6Y4_HARSA|nr:Neurofibromin [Harpegnathos saltator]
MQLPCRSGLQGPQSRANQMRSKECLIEISQYHFSFVISGLVKMLQRVSETEHRATAPSTGVQRLFQNLDRRESIIIVLDTLEKCLTNQPKDTTKLDEAMKMLLKEIYQFIGISHDSPQTKMIRELASKVLFALSLNFFNAELANSGDENPDCSDIEIIQHINVDVYRLTRLLNETIQKVQSPKKSVHLLLMSFLEKAIWNWMDTYPNEFAEVQKQPNEDLGKACEELFHVLDAFVDKKSRAAIVVWPLQIMLLVLSPKVLEEIVRPDKAVPGSPRHIKKRHFIENVKRGLGYGSSSSRQLTEAAAVTCVKLTKAATYISDQHGNNIVLTLVQQLMANLMSLLFNTSKPFSRGQNHTAQDVDLIIDCFISCFRINPHNSEVLKVCLNVNYPSTYQFVLVSSLIITQPRLSWWPQIDLLYPHSTKFRNMFTDTLNKVTQNYIWYAPLRMIHSLNLLKSKEDVANSKNVLLGMVRLIHADPMLMLHNSGQIQGQNMQNSTLELINGLVLLIHQTSMPDIADEAMEALLVLHHPNIIKAWNPEAPMNTYWDVSSQVLFSISQKLIQHQIFNYTAILKWLHEILIRRNAFLSQNKDNANVGSEIAICKQAHIKLEVVFLMYLWSTDTEAILISMSCFALLCEEADIRCGSDEVAVTCLLPNYHLYLELAQASNTLSTGQGPLQKKIFSLLRKIDHCVNGVYPAWEETVIKWEVTSRQLCNYPKTKTEDGQADYRSIAKRRAAHQNSEHELEDQLSEWGNMTGFLCALGGVCLQRPSSNTPPFSMSFSNPEPKKNSTKQQEFGSTSGLTNPNQEVQYYPVTQFVLNLLQLLICNNEKVGTTIQKHVKETIAHELSPALYPILFDQIKSIVEKFFDQQGPVILQDLNTQFIENTIFIIVTILESKTDQYSEYLGMTNIESMTLVIVRYVRHLDMSVNSISIKTKMCKLVGLMMKRRDDLAFRQELRFRNKLAEYLTEWVLCANHITQTTSGDTTQARVLNQACMEAVAALLQGLPLQPEETDRRDVMEVKSELFLKYFTLFMNLMNDCRESSEEGNEVSPQTPALLNKQMATLRDTTIQAMSNLLSANIDSGLQHSISLGYNPDLQTRAAFMEVLTKILQQGTQFDTLAETVLADRFEQLVQLVTMISDKGELPIAMALANVVATGQMDELARVFVTLFDAKHLLSSMLWNMFYREVELTDCIQTLFRGNTLACKIMAFCFKIYGSSYLQNLLEPLITPWMNDSTISFEIDDARISSNENIQQNGRNLIALTQNVFDGIVSSADRFPPQLRTMCHCLYQVLSQRFPQHPQNNIVAVGTTIFLRFINPAIVAPQEMGIVCKAVPSSMQRGLTLMSKILQNIANHVEFSKEQHMLPFNDFLRAHFETGQRFVIQITSNCETPGQTHHPMSFVSDANVLALHRLLWNHQERMGNYLSSIRDHKAVGRRPFDKLATLLAYLGPPEHKPVDSCSLFSSSYVRTMVRRQQISSDMSSTCFEEIMMKLNVHETEDFKSIQNTNIFYQAGTSKKDYPVFYYIARRHKFNEMNSDFLIYHVMLTLKPFYRSPYDVVFDFTNTNSENRFRTEFLQKWFYVLPEVAYENVHAAYIYNCNSWLREYAKCNDRILAPLKGNRKVIFVDGPGKLNDVIDVEQQKLPGATLSLDEDLKVFASMLKLSNKEIRVSVKIGSAAVQITHMDKTKVLWQYVTLNDVYYASEIEAVCPMDDSQFTLTISNEAGLLKFTHNDCESIVQAINHIKNRWVMSQSESMSVHAKIRPKDVPGTLLNMTLLNLGSPNPNLRTAAYNHLCALTATFDLKIEGQLLETSGLCIPSNNTIFIKHLSETLAANDPHLTLEFLAECIQGFKASTIELKHLCLEYITPWLNNLVRFYKSNDECGRRHKQLTEILDQLITLTAEEVEMYPSIQAKIWGTIGRLPELIDIVLDMFIQRSVQHRLGSHMAEILADTAVALASGNVQLVAKKVISRLCRMVDKTCLSPTQLLEQHSMWSDIAILARYLLMLSFNNCLDVGRHLPYVFHTVTFLVCSGSLTMRSCIHGLVINTIHSLCTCSSPSFREDTYRILHMSLDEFSLPKYHVLFGISKVKSAADTAFYKHPGSSKQDLCKEICKPPNEKGLNNDKNQSVTQDREVLSLTSLEVITDALLEIMEACMRDIPRCDWLKTWTALTRSFAFCYNPALQPRALIVFGCISKNVTDQDIKQLLRILVKALESFNDITLLEAIVMCLTRLQPLLRPESPIHRYLFWVATSVLELDQPSLYAAGLGLLEQNLHTLDFQGTFDTKTLEHVMMSTREPLEWHFKQLDHSIGLSFKSNFHFALVGHLLKGYRHPTTVTRTSRVLTMLLAIVAKPSKRDKFEVTPVSVPYLAALVSVSEEVRTRCHIRHSFTSDNRSHDSSGSAEILDSLRSTDINGAPNLTSRRQKTWDLLDQSALTQARKQKQHSTQRSRSMPSTKNATSMDDAESQTRNSNGVSMKSNENNVLLDPEVLTDLATQTLVLTVLATLVKYSTDEDEARILYEYLAEATIVFRKVFPVVHNLLDAKINSVLSSCHDQAILNAVQVIIQNMMACEDTCQQQLHYLQSCGFRGLWRFAGPYTNSNCTPESSELFVNCLEAMVETCLPTEECDGPNSNDLAAGRGRRSCSYQLDAKIKQPTVLGCIRRSSHLPSEETGVALFNQQLSLGLHLFLKGHLSTHPDSFCLRSSLDNRKGVGEHNPFQPIEQEPPIDSSILFTSRITGISMGHSYNIGINLDRAFQMLESVFDTSDPDQLASQVHNPSHSQHSARNRLLPRSYTPTPLPSPSFSPCSHATEKNKNYFAVELDQIEDTSSGRKCSYGDSQT